MTHTTLRAPGASGLYDPAFEHDACGLAFVADIAGRRSRTIVDQALEALRNLQHRGGAAEGGAGDGAGILVQMPDRFMRAAATACGVTLGDPGRYASGLVFLPHDPVLRHEIETIFAAIISEEGQAPAGWRDVPVNDEPLDAVAAGSRPVIRQVFVNAGSDLTQALQDDAVAFERRLYVIRRRVEAAVDALPEALPFHIVSLSARTFTWKGMLTAGQLSTVYPDLSDPALESALALVHQRFSTNTFPSWPLAHPYRFVAHNGEFNTLRGNVNWMRARQALLASPVFGADLERVLPVIRPGGSDTASFDNLLELLVLSGRSLPHAVLMMVPEPWSGHEEMSPDLRAFYEYHALLMEPWDGPAALAFTDGRLIGATLDRNGLRPLRYCVTREGMAVVASETGVLDIPASSIVEKGRVRPGHLFLVDTGEGRIVPDAEIKRELAAAAPYGRWVREQRLELDDLPRGATPAALAGGDLVRRQQMAGYTQEDLQMLLAPMAKAGDEPVGSMGSDAALAVLSSRPRLLFDYFKQGFAQVTNPPLDAIRERLVTSMESTLGAEGNLLDGTPQTGRRLRTASPVLDSEPLARIRELREPALRACTLPTLFPAPARPGALAAAVASLQHDAAAAVARGCTLLVLSDRDADERQAAIPSLLAVAAVHHHLVRIGVRAKCSLVVEAADVREVHHCALLLGYGAGAINPYLACDTIVDMVRQGQLPGTTQVEAVHRYLRALNKGILKVMSKMGISVLQSYRGAQIFEALGLDDRVVEEYFTGTPSRIGGVDLDGLARDVMARHRRAIRRRDSQGVDLDGGGEYQWRRDGEHHLFTPETVFKLQHATRSGQYGIFKEYTHLVDDQTRRAATLRGLLTFRPADVPLPLDEVEPVESILKRFATGAMSFGSISEEAHTTLAIAMNRLGARSNSGEGGEDPARFQPDAGGDSRRSAIKQVASGRFGVTSEYLASADEIQIKMAQGAKPGEGGQLPGAKVYPWIAKVRHSTPGVGLISPPPHHDIYSIEDLAQLIHDLREANPRARISVKLVASAGVGTIAAGVAKARADAVLISGHDGGTGAAPLTAIKHAGVPWELGLAETQQVLRLNNLRGRITVQADGQLKTGRDVVIAALLGAEEFGFATAPLVVSGCVMMRVCHLNTCPVGIATQDPQLRAKFTGQPEFIVNFFRFIAEEVREYMASLGFRTVEEMVGRADRLDASKAAAHAKAPSLDLSRILSVPDGVVPPRATAAGEPATDAGHAALLAQCQPAIEDGTSVWIRREVRNVDRAFGTRLGYEITRRRGSAGLPVDSIHLACAGSAGQSFGAFIPRGLTLDLEGDCNDYAGKGLSGGRLVIRPPLDAGFTAEANVIVGNVALYGATGGEAFIRGLAGERFAVRNSGAVAVVEGVGDHGCEYMTGGTVVVLGRVGRNFAAGMSGGMAFVVADDRFESRCNAELVDLEPVEVESDIALLHRLLMQHRELTGSGRAAALLARWPGSLVRFVKVMPRDYRRALASAGLTPLPVAQQGEAAHG